MKRRLIQAIVMAFLLSAAMSGWVTWINLGLVGDFPAQWFDAFRLAWPPAALIAFLIGPGVSRLSLRLDQLTGGGTAS